MHVGTVTIEQSTICVSGYAAVFGHVAKIDDHELFRTGCSSADTFALARGQTFVSPWRKSELWKTRTHCQKCGAYPPKEQFGDLRLGFDGYCDGCVEVLAQECVKQNGRLPTPNSEFYCFRCHRVMPNSERVKPGKDGKRRFICMPCRRSQCW